MAERHRYTGLGEDGSPIPRAQGQTLYPDHTQDRSGPHGSDILPFPEQPCPYGSLP